MDSHSFFWRTFLRHQPQRHAVMLDRANVTCRGQKYHEIAAPPSALMIRQHIAGTLTLAVPAVEQHRGAVLPLDVDAGGLACITSLIEAARSNGFWAFGQYCPRHELAAPDQRGYVWICFDTLVSGQQLQYFGERLLASVHQPGWAVESRAHAAVTRLPMGRHRHTDEFGWLVLPGSAPFAIDADVGAAWTRLQAECRLNAATTLPPLPALPASQTHQRPTSNHSGAGIDIHGYNTTTDLVTLLEQYGARRSRIRRALHCCGHDDRRRASLLLWQSRDGDLRCKCLSQHHNCPLADRMHDSFSVYCRMEGVDATEALRRLNSRPE